MDRCGYINNIVFDSNLGKQVRDAIFSVSSVGIYYPIAVFVSTGGNPESDAWSFSSISEHNSCLYTTRSLFTHIFHATVFCVYKVVFRSSFLDIARVRLTWFIIARSYCRLSMFYWGWVLILSELKTCCIADIIIVCGSVQPQAAKPISLIFLRNSAEFTIYGRIKIRVRSVCLDPVVLDPWLAFPLLCGVRSYVINRKIYHF